MNILVTGCAGFIGCESALQLLEQGHQVIGIDNLNDYYDVNLKHARLHRLADFEDFQFHQLDIKHKDALLALVHQRPIDAILNLAAQAGVRYSIENPASYVDSNLVGFANILEVARQCKVKHVVYASSSSVYGGNTQLPYQESHPVDQPVSLYAATKKANELMAHAYSHLYQIPVTGLRYFTVYGPWGRPDMAPMKFAQKILAGEPIDVYNQGDHSRDFTFIDDIVTGSLKVLLNPPSYEGLAAAKVYNIGNGQPVNLLRFIELLEEALGKKAHKRFLPQQPGDVKDTWADTSQLKQDFGYAPHINLEQGIERFAKWYQEKRLA